MAGRMGRRRISKIRETEVHNSTLVSPKVAQWRDEQVKKLEEAGAIVLEELPAIVQALVKEAKEGSYQHAKCLFEVARIGEIELPKAAKEEPWVEELLSALRALPVPEEPSPAS